MLKILQNCILLIIEGEEGLGMLKSQVEFGCLKLWQNASNFSPNGLCVFSINYLLESWPCAFENNNVLFILQFPLLQNDTKLPFCQLFLSFKTQHSSLSIYSFVKALVLPLREGLEDLLSLLFHYNTLSLTPLHYISHCRVIVDLFTWLCPHDSIQGICLLPLCPFQIFEFLVIGICWIKTKRKN